MRIVGDPALSFQDLFSVRGKAALVTGGSRGIGLMIAEALVQGGARVWINSRDAEACDRACAHLSQWGEAHAAPADLSEAAGVQALAAKVAERAQALHILVNNAGATWGASFESFPEKGWDKVVDLNLKAAFFLSQQLLGPLAAAASEADPARILNVASIEGLRVGPLETYSYSASKAGLIHLTRVMAKQLATRRIAVNAIAPGPFETRMMEGVLRVAGDGIRASVPLGRLGAAEDLAGVALYLSSRASAYLTGAVIPVDGGLSL